MVAALLPVLIPLVEALLTGIVGALAAHEAHGDVSASLTAGAVAALAKLTPHRVIPVAAPVHE